MQISYKASLVLALLASLSFNMLAQNSGVVSGQDTATNVVTTAVPFLTIAPDPVSGAMGDVGAATEPDVNASFWNPAKLAFVKDNYGLGLTYTPWLSKFVDDMSISYLTGYYKVNDEQAFGASLTYFNLTARS